MPAWKAYTMAVPHRVAAVVAFAVFGLGWGAVPLAVAAAPASAHAHAPAAVGRGGRPYDPYAGAGLLVRLPDGAHVHLVRPAGQARPERVRGRGSHPRRHPRPGPPKPAPTGSAPASSTDPDPGRKPAPRPTAPAAPPGRLPSALPIPVVGPLFPSGATPRADRHPSAPAGTSASAPVSDEPATASASDSDSDSPTASASPSRHRDYYQLAGPPAPTEPPPLGPLALARPPVVAPVAAPQAAPTGYSDAQLRRRLLPLGVGLALIGVGAALFGWKLRRL